MIKTEFEFTNQLFALFFALTQTVQTVVSFLLGGETCIRCSKWTVRIPVCKNCLPFLMKSDDSKRCVHCGRELVSEIGICSYCRENPALKSVDASYSLHGYLLWKKSLLFAWKMEDKRNLSPYFARLFHQKLTELEKELGLHLPVVPVPPRASKIREKGWDQIEEVCFYLERGWNITVLRLLERVSKIQQKKLDRIQRIEGISSSYRLKSEKKLRKILSEIPDYVILVDDVLTTGATIEACARELKKMGVSHVFSITLFMAN